MANNLSETVMTLEEMMKDEWVLGLEDCQSKALSHAISILKNLPSEDELALLMFNVSLHSGELLDSQIKTIHAIHSRICGGGK